MPARPPQIRIRGLRSNGVPKGYLLGRVDRGVGDVQLVNGRTMERLGVASARKVSGVANRTGFGFSAGGTLLAGETLGSGTLPHNALFADGNAKTIATAGLTAVVTAVLTLWTTDVSNLPVQFGTITFAASNPIGVVAFTGGSYTVLAGHPIILYAPAVAGSLGDVTGIVTGRSV